MFMSGGGLCYYCCMDGSMHLLWQLRGGCVPEGRLQGLSRPLSFFSTTWLPGTDCVAQPWHSIRSSSGGCMTASSPMRHGSVETI